MAYHTEVSITSLIRQNRKVVALFAIAGIIVLIAIPFILRAAPPETENLVEATQEIESSEPTPTPYIPKNYMKSPDGKEINLDFFPYVLGFLILLIPITALCGLIYSIYLLLSRIEGRKKHELPEETITIERLERESPTKEKEHLSSYERRIRRRYGRLIKSRTPKKAHLTALTPTELEYAADISGDGAETIHEIYRKTRYSPEPVMRESYVAFRDAVRKLPVSSHSENASE